MSIEANAQTHTFTTTAIGMDNRSEHVKGVFEDPRSYLKSRRVDVLFRTDTVRAFASRVAWRRLLDVGCGDGTISLQLGRPDNRLTLMDLSRNMTALTTSNIPEALVRTVEVLNGNFMTTELSPEPFDLIVTVGVLAHVDCPDAFLNRIRQHLRPGGHLILEFTDCRHFVGRMGRALDRLKEKLAPAKYQTNKLSFLDVAALLEKHQFRLVDSFRYSRIPLPLLGRFVSAPFQHRLAKLIFRDARRNTNASSGNEYICLLARD